MSAGPLRLLPSFREKIWGATNLEPWFRGSGSRTGEVWLTSDENGSEDGRTLAEWIRERGKDFLGTRPRTDGFPILVKFIFTSDRLSIQVHPDDAQAREWEGGSGKTEMWHILRAEPEATIALGLGKPVSRERLREAAESGEIEQMVEWLPVRAGDTFYTPPGTIHAIGAGVALCEIQQNSDITYRLYDYGRPRELHIGKAVAAASLERHPGRAEARDLGGGRQLLASCEHFATEAWRIDAAAECPADPGSVQAWVAIEGCGAIDGRPFSAGDAWVVPASAPAARIEPDGAARLLRTYVPG